MKCLITGAKGFLGRNISQRISGQYEVIEFHKPMCLDDVGVADIIIHCAAEIYDEKKMFESNVVLTHSLLQKALKENCKKFIYIGTSSEYGRMLGEMNEEDRINPTTLYEATKGCGTLLTQAFARQYGLPTIIVRPFSIYGPYENERKLIPTAYKAYIKKIPLSLVKTPVHDWTWIDDFTAGIEQLLTHRILPGDIVNFGTGIQTSNLTVIHMLEEFLNDKISYKELGTMCTYDSESWKCDNRYAKAMYEINFNTTLQAGLEKYVKWMKKFYV
jgi:nucleoside-diphosphate-sugar epimerase